MIKWDSDVIYELLYSHRNFTSHPGNSGDDKQLRYNAKILPGQMNLINDLDIILIPPQRCNQKNIIINLYQGR